MRIGIPRETKDHESRVGVTPDGVATLVAAGHEVLVEHDAGTGSGFADADYAERGARLASAAEAWDADLVVKIKEPLQAEYRYLRGQMIFAYLHLAGVDSALTEALLETRTTGMAFETIEDEQGRLPLLAPMSAVAGNMAPLMGGYYLAKFNQGRGVLLGTVLGKRHGKVIIVGDGVVGRHAAAVAASMGARVIVLGRHPERTEEIERIATGIEYALSNDENLHAHLPETDLLVGAALIRGARAPHIVSKAQVQRMPEGSVIVDVSIDQGGCVATSRPTSHSDPVYVDHGVTHYCVTNMPAAYPRTSTLALTTVTLPHAVRIAEAGPAALIATPGLAEGVNTFGGYITCRAVAESLGLGERYRPLRETGLE